MLEQLNASDGVLCHTLVRVIMALEALGYGPEHPDRKEAQQQLDSLSSESVDEVTMQPCLAPVSDTALAAFALGESGYESGLPLSREWLWNNAAGDVEGAAAALLVLSHPPDSSEGGRSALASRLLMMQSAEGGWTAFESKAGRTSLRYLPFCATGAMVDTPCPAITGRVLEALCGHEVPADHAAVRRAVDCLFGAQEQDGSWSGSWGVSYIYGACHALRGLRAAGVSDREAAVLRGGEWLRSIQNADGGWGESCESHSERCFVPAASTPTQTAWAILGLLAGGDTASLSVSQGVEYLLNSQQSDGTWSERTATACGVPGGLYLTNDLHGICFPLLALSEFVKTRAASE